MRSPLLVLILLGQLFPMLSGFVPTAHAAPNPFTSPTQNEPKQASESALVSPLAPILQRIIMVQNTLRQSMSRAAESIHDHPLGGAFWTFILLAFAYGAAHALGPGHGKILAASYFLHRRSSARQVLFYSYLAMVLHVLSATVLVLGGKYLLQMSASRAVNDMGRLLQDVSYGMLLLVGLCMLVGAIRGCWEKAADEPVPVPSAGTDGKAPWKSLSALALATGLVPCPGASLVLIFSISMDILGAGLLAMVAISLGMGLCLTTVSLLAMYCRQGMIKCMERRSNLLRIGHRLLSLAGSLLITAMGGLLLLGSLLG